MQKEAWWGITEKRVGVIFCIKHKYDSFCKIYAAIDQQCYYKNYNNRGFSGLVGFEFVHELYSYA